MHSTWSGDIDEIMKHVQVEKAALVGHSLSTIVTSNFATRNPGKISKLVLIGPMQAPQTYGPQVVTGMKGRATTVREKGQRAVADTVMGTALSQKSKEAHPILQAFVLHLVTSTNPEGYAQACEALSAASEPDWTSVGKNVDSVLLLAGSEDYLAKPAVLDSIKKGIAAGGGRPPTEEIINGIGHWTNLEAPTKVATTLRDFLAVV